MTVALVTSIYGDYDTLVDPPEQEGVDEYIAVVDRHHDGCSRWTQLVEPRAHLHPRMAAKVAKCRPDLYTDADVTVWMDGGARLADEQSIKWAVGHGGVIAQFRHPERDDVSAEADASYPLRKYEGQRVVEQAAHYKAAGLPDHWGLWACGLIVRHTQELGHRFGNYWLAEQLRWSWQDQISEPYLLWRNMLRPVPLDGSLWSNPCIRFTGHVSEL